MRHPVLKRNNATTVVLFINRCILLKKMPTYLRKTHSLGKLTLGIVIL